MARQVMAKRSTARLSTALSMPQLLWAGGTVIFPAGTYLSFSVRLRSHIQLRLEPGATILAADSPLPGEATGYNGGTYDSAEPNAWDAYQDYGHNHWHNSLIWGEGLENCSIVGPGLI